MNLIINGNNENVNTKDNISITDLLKIKNVEMPDMVSVECNGKILDRSDFDSIIVNEGDRIEFLYFMGGGNNIK